MTLTSFRTPFNVFDEALARLAESPANQATQVWTPAVDVIETEHEIVLKADLPGVPQEAIEVKFENGTLSIKGERKFDSEAKGPGFRRIERGYGAFARHYTLPDTLDVEHVKADYRNGELTITLPKKEAAKSRTIPVVINA
jgi:HSP20 family protein